MRLNAALRDWINLVGAGIHEPVLSAAVRLVKHKMASKGYPAHMGPRGWVFPGWTWTNAEKSLFLAMAETFKAPEKDYL